LFVDLSVGGRGSGATLGRGRLLPGRGFRLGMYASNACCASCFDLELPADTSGLKDTRGQNHTSISATSTSSPHLAPVYQLQATSGGCDPLGVFFVAIMTRSATLVAIVLAQATAFVAPPAAAPALTPRQGLLEPYGSQKSASKHDRTARLLALARRRFRPIHQYPDVG